MRRRGECGTGGDCGSRSKAEQVKAEQVKAGQVHVGQVNVGQVNVGQVRCGAGEFDVCVCGWN